MGKTSLKNWSSHLAISLGLASAAFAAHAETAGELLLFVYPPNHRIDWTSPASTFKSTLLSGLVGSVGTVIQPNSLPSMIGHAVVRYRCVDEDGKEHDAWTGLTGQNDPNETRNDLLRDEIGFGVLFKMYEDGALVSSDVARNEVARNQGRREKGRAHEPLFARFPVRSAAECGKLTDFVEGFRSRSEKDLLYGFGHEAHESYEKWIASGRDPRVRLGGGCTSFGAGVLKILGRYDGGFERFWRRTVKISERLIGGEDRPRVSVTSILGGLGRSWSVPGHANRELLFYDPERMWEFLDGTRACASLLEGDKPNFSENCTPDLLAWTREHRSEINVRATVPVVGEFTRYVPTPPSRGGGGGQMPPRKVVESRTVVRQGIDFLR